MAKFEPERRNVVEPFVDFNPSSDSSVSVSPIRSLALSKKSDSETLLYAGSASGNLLLLSLNPARNSSENDVSKAKNVTFMRYVRMSDRSVDFIHVVTAIDKVLVVSGGFIYFLDPLLLQPLKKLSSLRGVSVVARRVRSRQTDSPNTSVGGYSGLPSSSTTGQRLLQKFGGGIRSNGGVKNKESELNRDDNCVFAAAVDKRLMLLGLDSTGESLVILEEYQCPNGVNSLVWLDDSIIIGAAGGYYLYSCVVGQSALICSLPDPSTPPYLKLLSKENQVLLLVDNVGVTVNAQGQPVGGSLVFREAPDSVGELARYLVVVKNGKMELYHKKSGNCVQMIPVTGEGVGPFIVADEEDGSGKVVAVATPSKEIGRYMLQEYLIMVACPIKSKSFRKHDPLTEQISSALHRIICYQTVPSEEQIKDLLRKKNFQEVFSLVGELQSEGELMNEMLSFVHAQVGYLLLFDLHFEEAIDHFLLSETMQPSEIFPFIMRDPNRWSLLKCTWKEREIPIGKETSSVLSGEDPDADGKSGRKKFLSKFLQSYALSRYFGKLQGSFMESFSHYAAMLPDVTLKMVPRNRYWGLHPPPSPIENVIDDGLVAIQRAIFLRKAGIETALDDKFLLNPPSRADLLQSAIKNVIRYLQVSRGKDLTPLVREGVDTLLMYLYRALNLVDEMERLASSENSCVVEELEALLKDSGHLRALAFLYASKGMNSEALAIWRILARNHSPGYWKEPAGERDLQEASTNAKSGKFTAAVEASKILEKSSDQDLILQHLGWILTRYLQWLIEDQDSDDPQFHTSYALLLANSAIQSYATEVPAESLVAGNVEEICNSDSARNSIFHSPVRERLQIFLQSSDLFDPEEVLYLIEGSELWLEKVLQNSSFIVAPNPARMKIFGTKWLLEMYLDAKDGKEPMLTAAVRLLHNHGESLDPLQVLERLSPDMPLHLASETLLRMLRARLHHHLQGQSQDQRNGDLPRETPAMEALSQLPISDPLIYPKGMP
ncbi:hypothetical protein RJ640_021514 [Escallonia rubra]|uniref:CNH domain-containing protein n=1 Tax=Escallonia rubra TaxID=112253 RepID=A0AA88QUM3_9ASTE|nr:hypothetical protein RJ640_021514 [Escallonia rubra]